ncbi:MAG: glycosyltransferase family 4 protein [bacterium]|nr:glycosyltransferase family 4 protein [bacterium]
MLGWELPPHNSGGLGVACFYMAKALAQDGAKIDFIVPYANKHREIDFMRVINATDYSSLHKFGAGAYDSANFQKITNNSNKHLPSIREIQKEYAQFLRDFLRDGQNRPDVIHAHDWLTAELGVLAKEITGAPLFLHIHATEFDRAGGNFGNQEIHQIESKGIRKADRVFAVSKNTRQVILEKYQVEPRKVEVVYNAIEPKELAKPEDYDTQTYQYLEHLKSQGYTVVMTLTRFTVQKGLHYLMEAVAEAAKNNPKIALLLVGDGEQRNELIEMAAHFGIADKIFFTGFLRGKKWRDAYGVADIFVMSSVNEPFGLTALEAAHFSNALIISNQSGVGEILKNILRYDFWDTQKLASHILAVSTSPSLLRDLQKGVRKEYARISWGDIAEQIMGEYLSITEVKND